MSVQETMELRIPADAAYLSVARMFGGSVARTFGLDPERTEDLRLALSEICASAVEARRGEPSTVAIDVSWDDATVRVNCPSIALAADSPRWMLIQALMPDVRANSGGGVAFSITR